MSTPKRCGLLQCPKCGYCDGGQTWRGPRYINAQDTWVGRPAERVVVSDSLEYTCEGCGYKRREECFS